MRRTEDEPPLELEEYPLAATLLPWEKVPTELRKHIEDQRLYWLLQVSGEIPCAAEIRHSDRYGGYTGDYRALKLGADTCLYVPAVLVTIVADREREKYPLTVTLASWENLRQEVRSALRDSEGTYRRAQAQGKLRCSRQTGVLHSGPPDMVWRLVKIDDLMGYFVPAEAVTIVGGA